MAATGKAERLLNLEEHYFGMASAIRTYSCETRWNALWREALCLYQNHRLKAAERVNRYIEELHGYETMLEARFGRKMEDMDVLDIGPGPFLVHMSYFAQHNRVTGIDLDVVPMGFSPKQYVEMCRRNGVRRAVKTILRKVIGIDRQYRREVRRRLTRPLHDPHRVLRMDASEMSFQKHSFDLVHSRSVFHHIPSPEIALSEVTRVLKPEGIAILSFHLYTSENGSLDPRVYTDDRGGVLAWSHLRRSTRDKVLANAFINRLRLHEWRARITAEMPGADIILRQNRRNGVMAEARELRASGELAEYSLEELLTDEVIVVWQKPRA